MADQAGLKLWLARIAARIEPIFARGASARKVARVDDYVGYATPGTLVVRGRLLDHRRAAGPGSGRRLANARQMLRLFITHEVPDRPVRHGATEGISDEEGYFTLVLPRSAHQGLVNVPVTADGVAGLCPVILPAPDAECGIISDIDDTMLLTGASSLWRNLWTSLTGNAESRVIFPDAVALMKALQAGTRNPVFFVSSSPWNFHDFLQDVFARNGLPQAPMFLRDYGIGPNQFITGTHGDHKSVAIDTVLAANPDLPFVLVGDTGQHDAAIYADAIGRHPGRIARVILREAGAINAADKADQDRIRQTGVPLVTGPDYMAAIAMITGDGGVAA